MSAPLIDQEDDVEIFELNAMCPKKYFLNITGHDGTNFKIDASFIPSSFNLDWVKLSKELLKKKDITEAEVTFAYATLFVKFANMSNKDITAEWMSQNFMQKHIKKICEALFKNSLDDAPAETDSKNEKAGE